MALSPELIFTILLAIALFASIAAKRTKIPYTIFLVFIGIGVAATQNPSLAPLYQTFTSLLGGGLFVGIILPPLLFESTLSIKTAVFRTVSRGALILATVGVVVATVVVGFVLWHFGGLAPISALVFAAIVAPTDVATVLEIFHRIQVPDRLSTLMETESVFNDPTGIALLTVVLTSFAAATSGPTLVGAVEEFVIKLGGGILVGLLMAGGSRLVQRAIEDPISQVVLTMAAVYGSYGIAEALGVSGLIAVAVTGLLYGNIVLFRIQSAVVEQVTVQFWSILGFLANTIAFLFIGLSTDIFSLAAEFVPILVAFAVVVLSRAFVVYPILSVPRITSQPIPWSWKNIAFLGGMRGALSIALVASLPTDLPGYSTVVSLTFGVAIMSILVQGPLLSLYAKRVFNGREPPGGAEVRAAPAGPAQG